MQLLPCSSMQVNDGMIEVLDAACRQHICYNQAGIWTGRMHRQHAIVPLNELLW